MADTKHPGAVLLHEFMYPLEITASRLALALRIRPQRLSHILSLSRGITPELALRLARLLDTTPRYWMDLQSEYKLAQAEAKLREVIDSEVHPLVPQHLNIDVGENLSSLTENQKKIYAHLSDEPISFDLLWERTGLDVGALSANLVMLELDKALVVRAFADSYIKATSIQRRNSRIRHLGRLK